MGATTFYTVSSGTNAKDAFDNAVRDAEYVYGHRGYTGTIAEKTDFVVIDDQGRDQLTAGEMADALIEAADDRIDDKWGPAGAIKLNEPGLWLFFGWASE